MRATQIERIPMALSHTRRHVSLHRVVMQLLLVIFSVIFSIPFYWLVSTSLKTDVQIMAFPIVWIPNPLTLRNYVGAFQSVPLAHFVWNTIIIAFGTVLGAVLSNTLVAYGLARIDWPLAKPLFVIII